MAEMTRKQGKRLTLFIFIALILGIALGFVLNSTYIRSENDQLVSISSSMETLQKQMAGVQDTTTDAYRSAAAIKADLAGKKSVLIQERDKNHSSSESEGRQASQT